MTFSNKYFLLWITPLFPSLSLSFQPNLQTRFTSNAIQNYRSQLFSSNGNDSYDSYDPNRWNGADDIPDPDDDVNVDWMAKLSQNEASWETSYKDDETSASASSDDVTMSAEEDDGEAWLDILQSISADEVEFMNKEADRADKVRRMQEMGLSKKAIESTLGVATDTSKELDELEDAMFQQFQEETAKSGFGMVVTDIDDDLTKVESHNRVEIDEDTGEPVRAQMVYVDEHTCIGCTNCAMIAQSTFFMDSEHGRARVFQQWGDDDETIQVAIETCPVDCIHYVPYDELKRLEIERRDQNINFKARLVSQGEYGGSNSHQVGGAVAFTAAQKISGNMGSRCNNCPTRGCKSCPMFGVGKNPYFEEKEKARLEKKRLKELKAEMEKMNKSADL